MDRGLQHYRGIKNAPPVNDGDSRYLAQMSGGQRFLYVILLQLNRNKLGYAGALLQRENDAAV